MLVLTEETFQWNLEALLIELFDELNTLISLRMLGQIEYQVFHIV